MEMVRWRVYYTHLLLFILGPPSRNSPPPSSLKIMCSFIPRLLLSSPSSPCLPSSLYTLLTGNIGQLNLPIGMQTVNFQNCKGLTGNIGQLNLPVGMQTVNFQNCKGLTGTVQYG
jgi:hypothetical protein